MNARSVRGTAIFVLLTASCASHAGSSNASPTTKASAPGATTTTTEHNQDGSLDLHTVDWHNFAVPGASCLRRKDVRLRSGQALLPDNTNGHPSYPSGTGPRYDMPRHVLPTLLSVSAITPGTITVHEDWYGPNDLLPKRESTTRWALSAGGLVSVATSITAYSK